MRTVNIITMIKKKKKRFVMILGDSGYTQINAQKINMKYVVIPKKIYIYTLKDSR